jgi:hypothetical protein
LNGKGDDERGDKGGYALDCQRQLFGNAVVVDVVAICGGLCGYGGGGCIRIEVCDILADDLLDEVDARRSLVVRIAAMDIHTECM